MNITKTIYTNKIRRYILSGLSPILLLTPSCKKAEEIKELYQQLAEAKQKIEELEEKLKVAEQTLKNERQSIKRIYEE